MSVPAAYLGVILIWATTPLAIKWSGEGVSYLFGLAARMSIGLAVVVAVALIMRVAIPWRAGAWRTYLAGATGLYGAMTLTYWGAQFIPSGLISVLFGLTPIATGLMAASWLKEPFFVPARLFGVVLGLLGLGLVFLAGGELAGASPLGMLAVVLAVTIQSGSAVWVKRLGAELHPVAVNAGALSVAVPAYLLTWLVLDGRWPAALPEHALGAIAYLALFGTALGFILYFHVLKHLRTGVIALITLVTPVLALLIGRWLNHEAVGSGVWAGTALIVTGLLVYEWGGQLKRLLWRQSLAATE